MKTEATKEHQWLQKLVGEWTCEGEAVMKPGEPPTKWKGTERVRSLGDLWVIADGVGEMPDGGQGLSMMTLGYDPQKGFIGTFVASMGSYLWIYNGSLDASERTLTLDTEGPDMSGEEGKMAKYQDIIEIQSDNERTMRSQMLGPDGKWTHFMTMRLRRK